MQANDIQVGGSHYASPYQHWDFVAEALQGRYLEGQITKYVYRWRKKNGTQDLEKALHFTNKLLETASTIQSLDSLNGERGVPVEDCVNRFIKDCQHVDGMIIRGVALWEIKPDLETVRDMLMGLIAANRS